MLKYAVAKAWAEKTGAQVLLPSNSLLLQAFRVSATLMRPDAYGRLLNANKNSTTKKKAQLKYKYG